MFPDSVRPVVMREAFDELVRCTRMYENGMETIENRAKLSEAWKGTARQDWSENA
jgi:hypothetical protein